MDNYSEDGYSDGGLYSDEDVKPPPTYNLNRRRNAFCVTTANTQVFKDGGRAGWKTISHIDDGEPPPASVLQKRRNAIYGFPSPNQELIPEEAKLLVFMKQQGVKPYFPEAKVSEETDYTISSDEDDIYYSKRSDKSQQTSLAARPSVKTNYEPPQVEVTNWKQIADAEVKMKKKLPGFLHAFKPAYQRPLVTTKITADMKMDGPPPPSTVDAAIGPVSSFGRTRHRPAGNAVNALKENSNFRVM